MVFLLMKNLIEVQDFTLSGEETKAQSEKNTHTKISTVPVYIDVDKITLLFLLCHSFSLVLE